MNEFLKSNPKLDSAIESSTNFEDLRETIKQELAAQGVIVRQREEGNYGAHFLRQPETFTETRSDAFVSANPENDKFVRVIYPAGNNRFEIYGSSEADLDAKEGQIRAMFGQ